MIERALANVFDLELFRPARLGAAMDPSGPPVSLADALTAIYEPTQALLQTVEGREVRITARFFIDPVDNGGAPIDPQADDWLQYTDFAGDLVKQQRIIRVSPWWICGDLDYLELEIGRV